MDRAIAANANSHCTLVAPNSRRPQINLLGATPTAYVRLVDTEHDPLRVVIARPDNSGDRWPTISGVNRQI
jgi:hypothetical protein